MGLLRRRKLKPFTMELERDNWCVIYVALASTFPVILPNLCNEKVASALAAKYEASGITIIAVLSAGELADRLKGSSR